jgi:hypothetical protein
VTLSLEADTDALVNELLDLRAEAAKIKERTDAITAELIERLGVGGEHSLPGLPDVGVYVARPAMRFKPGKAVQVLTVAQLESISEMVPIGSKAKNVLLPELYAQLLEPDSRPSVRSLADRARP